MNVYQDIINKISKLEKTSESKEEVLSYDKAKREYYLKTLKSKINSLINLITNAIANPNENNKLKLIELKKELEINHAKLELNKKSINRIKEILFNNENLILELFDKKKEEDWIDIIFNDAIKAKLPSDIKQEVIYDLEEIRKCYKIKAYRSVIILCARILEVCLHRKYYDLTGIDLLEKAPGIGLGNLIARLREKGIEIDPALSQQIHLINQIRIFSVHKKSYTFTPTKEQTQAILLYLIDLLKRFFIS